MAVDHRRDWNRRSGHRGCVAMVLKGAPLMPRLHPSIALLLDLVDEAFDHAAWHGPTLRGSLRSVTEGPSVVRPAAARHNIRELTCHARRTGNTGAPAD